MDLFPPVFQILKEEKNALILLQRQPEPSLTMDGIEQTLEYNRGSTLSGPTLPVYLYHLPRMAQLFKPGGTVLDLGCGNAFMLCKFAALFPDMQFYGLDLSTEMLQRARENQTQTEAEFGRKLKNLQFIVGSMLELGRLGLSFDTVTSNFAVHHLPDLNSFEVFFLQIEKVLRAQGTLYVSDLLRPKSAKTVDLLADYSYDKNFEYLKEDYYYSLHASFSSAEVIQAVSKSKLRPHFSKTKLIDFMFVLQSQIDAPVPQSVVDYVKKTRQKMTLKNRLGYWSLQFLSTNS